MNVLVDTSVWIRALSGRPPYRDGLDTLLDLQRVVGHDLVFGELLIGDKGGRGRLLDDYARMPHAPVISRGELVTFVRTRKLHGRGVGWIDIHLLASTLVGGLRLWTADPALESLATELGVNYK